MRFTVRRKGHPSPGATHRKILFRGMALLMAVRKNQPLVPQHFLLFGLKPLSRNLLLVIRQTIAGYWERRGDTSRLAVLHLALFVRRQRFGDTTTRRCMCCLQR